MVGNSVGMSASLEYQLGRDVQLIVSDFKGIGCSCMRLAFSSIGARMRVLSVIVYAEVWGSLPVVIIYVDRYEGELTRDAPKLHGLSVL